MTTSCLCCQRPLEAGERHHPRCLNRLFGSTRKPMISFGSADLPALIAKAEGRMSISGVQIKVTALFDKKTGALETTAVGGTHVLKPAPDRFPQLPENENLCMNMAESLGMPVPPHGLFAMADGKLCYVIKRFDRISDGTKLHKESLFQILESKDKYSGSLEIAGKAIYAHAANVGLDMVDFFERVLFCFISGNGDMHLKNWALLGEGANTALAPCYDLVCSRIYIPNEDDSALTINAKKSNLSRADFETLAKGLGIDPKATANIFKKFLGAEDSLRRMIAGSELRSDLRQETANTLGARYKRLFGTE